MEEYEIVLEKAKGEMDIKLSDMLDDVLNKIDEFLENKPGDYFDYGDRFEISKRSYEDIFLNNAKIVEQEIYNKFVNEVSPEKQYFFNVELNKHINKTKYNEASKEIQNNLSDKR